MELMLGDTADIELSDNDSIRVYIEPHDANKNLDISYDYYGWEKFEESKPLQMSAIGCYFAHKVHKNTGVPIGIICCYKGLSGLGDKKCK